MHAHAFVWICIQTEQWFYCYSNLTFVLERNWVMFCVAPPNDSAFKSNWTVSPGVVTFLFCDGLQNLIDFLLKKFAKDVCNSHRMIFHFQMSLVNILYIYDLLGSDVWKWSHIFPPLIWTINKDMKGFAVLFFCPWTQAISFGILAVCALLQHYSPWIVLQGCI